MLKVIADTGKRSAAGAILEACYYLLMDAEALRTIGLILLASLVVGVTFGGLLLALAVRQLRRIKIPPDAGFAETLRLTPLSLVLALDLLDLGLDVLAAPFTWAILDRYGLKALRGFAMVEALIPATQFIPTLTISWLAARLLAPDKWRTT